ncbi:hypothetical protein [Variovorax sp. E3]|uniref:hypothetical protein n=1 Tax=Variovorax sp. E3 TaxID=1914993 RepID=UPI0018DE8F47|nr:hypothetical protein [Variovorax sp. E3]
MDYTLSNSYDTDPGTGNRMHEDSKAVPTAVSDLDMNSLIWSSMEIVKAAGLPGIQFDKVNPASYRLLLKALRSNALVSGLDTGAANAAVLDFAPPVDALVDNMVLWFKAKATSTGRATLNVSSLGVKDILDSAHNQLQGGEIVANGTCQVVWKASLNSFVLVGCTGSPVQAAQGSRIKGLTGNTVGAGFTTATFSAAEVLMRNPTTGNSRVALNVGPVVCNINTAGPAANGRDQVAAFGSNSWVHFWFITDGTAVATLASASATAPTLPTGFAAQAYIGAVRLGVGTLANVRFYGATTTYNTSQQTLLNGQAAAMTAVNVAAFAPPNALAFSLMVRDFVGTPASGTGIFDLTQSIGPTATDIMFRAGFGGTQSNVVNATTGGWTFLVPNIAQQYFYSVASGNSQPVSTSHHINSYKNPNGGE